MKIHPFFFKWGNKFFFRSKDIKEVFSSLFLLIMSCANGVLHLKVYGHCPLFYNYLMPFYPKRSNLGLLQGGGEQTESLSYQRAELRTLWLKYDFSPP